MGKTLSNGGFTVNFLANERAVVSQGDNQQVISTEQYFELQQRSAFSKAEAEYDEAVKEFHKPLTDAAEKLTAAQDASYQEDDTFIEVLKPAVEGVLSASAEIVHLEQDTVILRLVEADETDRLMWVNGSIEILAK